MKKWYTLLTGLLITSASWAQILVTRTNTPYTENFNTLASSGSGHTAVPTGFSFSKSGAQTYAAATGSSIGNTFSFGTSTSTERAFGSVGSVGTGTVRWGFTYVNNTGVPITSIAVGYTGEQWRDGGDGQHQLTFAYNTGTNPVLTSGTYTAVNELGFNSPFNSSTQQALDGNTAGNRTVFAPVTIPLATPLAVGSQILIRWEDIDHSGNDHGLAIDDVSVTFGTALPAQPTDLARDPAAAVYSSNDITVPWAENSNNETGFVLERNTVASPTDPNWTLVTTTPANTVTFRDTPPAARGGYYYRVKATNATGDSPYSYNTDNALPVTYLNFAARYQSGQVAVTWETATERDNAYFDVERSTDAKTFAAIGRQPGNGLSTSRQSYSFRDETPAPGWNYYRLKQVDTDGTVAYSRPTAVLNEGNPAATLLRLFPNPTTNQLRLDLDGNAPVRAVRVSNGQGQVLLNRPDPGPYLNVNELPTGLYLIEVQTEDGRTLCQRFVKE